MEIIQPRLVEALPLVDEHIPLWLEAWRGAIGWAKKNVTHLDPLVIQSMFPAGRNGPVYALANFQTDDAEYVKEAFLVLYRSIHGRPATDIAYQATSALGRKFITKCWYMAGKVRHGPEVREDRKFDGRVYSAMAQVGRNEDTRLSYLINLRDSVVHILLNSGKHSEHDASLAAADDVSRLDIPSTALLAGDINHRDVGAFITGLTRAKSKVFSKFPPSSAVFTNIVSDIFVMDRSYMLPDDALELVQPLDEQTLEMIRMPADFSLEVGDEVQEEEEIPDNEDLKRAACAFAQGQPNAVVYETYKGLGNFQPDPFVVDLVGREEIDAALEVIAEMERRDQGGADEAA
jgi:hypothetical protein